MDILVESGREAHLTKSRYIFRHLFCVCYDIPWYIYIMECHIYRAFLDMTFVSYILRRFTSNCQEKITNFPLPKFSQPYFNECWYFFAELDPKTDEISEKILYRLLNISEAHIDVLKIFLVKRHDSNSSSTFLGSNRMKVFFGKLFCLALDL